MIEFPSVRNIRLIKVMGILVGMIFRSRNGIDKNSGKSFKVFRNSKMKNSNLVNFKINNVFARWYYIIPH